jgi:penicillin G amidase
VATAGSRYTVDVSAFDYNKPYGVTAIPSYRQIIDLSDMDKSLSMHTTGQSGLVFSKHYDDMITSWVNVQYHPMLFNARDVEADRKSALVMAPAGR